MFKVIATYSNGTRSQECDNVAQAKAFARGFRSYATCDISVVAGPALLARLAQRNFAFMLDC